MKPLTALMLVCAFCLGLLSQRLIGQGGDHQLQLRELRQQQQRRGATARLVEPRAADGPPVELGAPMLVTRSRARPIIYGIDSLKRGACPEQARRPRQSLDALGPGFACRHRPRDVVMNVPSDS